MTEQSATEAVSKVVRVVDVQVIADLSAVTQYIRQDDYDRRARALEDAVKEFNEFIRDHRSQDYVRLEVQRVTEEQCSGCKSAWETMTEDGMVCCSSCGEVVA